jgi:ribA/ribD-fused uncharacterized protein
MMLETMAIPRRHHPDRTDMTPEQHLVSLRQADLAGEPMKILAFWGHRPERDGSVGAGCLSQWWPAPFVVDGINYPTAEHWMMAGKARLFNDDEGLAAVMTANSPGAAKAAGREVRGFDERQWAASRYALVVAGNRAKFTQHEDLQRFLAQTGNKILVEASPYDRIWGVGMAPSNPDIHHPSKWRGQNLLGFALMTVREQL